MMDGDIRTVLTLLVNNQPGVLIRIALVFARRSYNIDSLITHPTHDKKFSIITISARGEEKVLGQILKQLNKLVDVIHAVDRTHDDSVQLEMSLMKIKLTVGNRSDVLHLANTLECTIVDISSHTIILSCMAKEDRLNSIEKIMESYGIIEVIRTGTVLMLRGSTPTA